MTEKEGHITPEIGDMHFFFYQNPIFNIYRCMSNGIKNQKNEHHLYFIILNVDKIKKILNAKFNYINCPVYQIIHKLA